MRRRIIPLVVAGCAVAAWTSIGGLDAGRVAAASQLVVDSTAPSGGDCSRSGQCTLGAAVARAASLADVTIELPAGTFVVSAPLSLPASGVTIHGAGDSTVVSGNGSVRLFEATGGSVAFEDLVLRDGFADDSGAGAILATNTALTLDGLVVSGNGANGDGGAIGVIGGSLAISGSTFSANTGQSGGAVFAANAPVSISGSTFTGNGASSTGGAALISFPTAFAVADSTFSANQSVTDGGALSLEGVGDTGTAGRIDRTTFDGNDAAGLGGAVFVRTSPTTRSAGLVVADSTFTGNGADAGGALALSDPPVAVAHSTFQGNSAEGSGGAIVSNTSLSVADSTFEQNSSGDSGGAIASSGALAVTRSGFDGNHAGGSGGVFELIGAPPVIDGTFSGNDADGNGPVALWTGSAKLSIAGVAPEAIFQPLAVDAVMPPTDPAPGSTVIPPSEADPATPGTSAAPATPGESGAPGTPDAPGAPPTTTPATAPGGTLPRTGADVAATVRFAAIMVALGAGLLVVIRRRRPAR